MSFILLSHSSTSLKTVSKNKILGNLVLKMIVFIFSGDIGGSLSLYLGASILTFFAILDLILRSMSSQ